MAQKIRQEPSGRTALLTTDFQEIYCFVATIFRKQWVLNSRMKPTFACENYGERVLGEIDVEAGADFWDNNFDVRARE